MADGARPGTAEAFREGCADQRLRLARCGACGFWIHFPKPACPRCWSDRILLEEPSGRGRLHTWVLDARRDPNRFLAVVELDEQLGLRLPALIDGWEDGVPPLDAVVELGWDGAVPSFRPS